MQDIIPRYKFHLYRNKVALLILLLGVSITSFSQINKRENLPYYDDQLIHYGFLIGIHTSNYQIKYSDAFVESGLDSVHSIIPGRLPGFKLGFIANFHFFQYLDVRGSVTFGFYENDLTYRYTDGTEQNVLKDATMVEVPIYLKYKSQRRGNVGVYMLGGINPAFEASARGDEDNIKETLETKGFNLAMEVGVGLDIYYPLFKFSPEVKYAYSFTNLLQPNVNEFNVGIQSLVAHNITFAITFEGGPK